MDGGAGSAVFPPTSSVGGGIASTSNITTTFNNSAISPSVNIGGGGCGGGGGVVAGSSGSGGSGSLPGGGIPPCSSYYNSPWTSTNLTRKPEECSSSTEREARSVALEKAYVHDVYQQIACHFSDSRYRAWPRVKQFLLDLEPGSFVCDVGKMDHHLKKI